MSLTVRGHVAMDYEVIFKQACFHSRETKSTLIRWASCAQPKSDGVGGAAFKVDLG